MKKHLLFALILFMALPGMAQRARIRPPHGGGHPHAATLTIIAPQDLCLWLFIDDVLQNENAVHSICIRNLEEDSYYVRVELDNEPQNCVGQFVDLRQSKTLTVIHSWKCWGFDDYQTYVTPELTMDLVTAPYVNGHNQPNMPPAPVPVHPMSFGMSPEDYEYAYQLITKESFDSSKLTLAKQVVSGNPMTASQILGICKLFSFESNKLEFAKFAYGYCVDPNKYYMLNDAFTYESSKRELDEFIRGL